MKRVNSTFQEVLFSYTFDALMTSIHADSAYIAMSVGATMSDGEKSILPSFIITEDETPFVQSVLSQAHTAIMRRMSAYLADQPEAQADVFAIQIYLPENRKAEYDVLIMNELQRAYVTFVLARWYEQKLPEIALRQHQLYESALSSAMHDIFMMYGGRRKSCYY